VAIEFNYYDFKEKNQLKYEADIDLSGLHVKANPTAAIIDEDTGEVTETNLDEIKDDNVNFVYTGAFNGRINNVEASQGTRKGKPLRDYIFDPNAIFTDENDGKAIYTSGEYLINTQDIEFTEPRPIVTSEGVSVNSDPAYYTVAIEPRHNLLKSNGPGPYTNRSDVSADVDILAILNLWDSDSRARRDNARGFIDRKTFFKRIENLKAQSEGRNLGIEITEYPEDLTEGGLDLNKSGLSRDTKVGELSGIAATFINEPDATGEPLHKVLQPLSDENIVPFTLSVKEGFRSWFTTKEELYNEYLNSLNTIQTLIEEFPYASSYVDNDDLNNLGYVPIIIDIPTNNVADIQYTTSGQTITIPPEATLRGAGVFNTDLTRSTYVKINSIKANVYQVIRDSSGEWVFVKDSGNRILVKELQLNGSPSEIYNKITDAHRDLTAGIMDSIGASTLLGVSAIGAGVVETAANIFFNESNAAMDKLNEIIALIKQYEAYTNESVFPNTLGADASKFYFTNNKAGIAPKSYDGKYGVFEYDKRVARVLVPVDFGYKRSKKSKGTFGGLFTQYVYEDLGVRWIYVNLIDTSAFTAYRKNQAPSGQKNYLHTPIESWSLSTPTVSSPVRGELTLSVPLDLDKLGMEIGDDNIVVHVVNTLPLELNGYWQVSIKDEVTLEILMNSGTPVNAVEEDGAFGMVMSLITPFEETQPDDNNIPVTIDYNIPYLPIDETLRNLAFEEYGPFDQSEFAVRTRSGKVPVEQADGTIVYKTGDNTPGVDNYIPPGWEIFHESSKDVSAMRDGIDVYNKVDFLLRILISEFGETRVRLVETTRSLQDQNNLQLGGASSNFLSWHNYGLAARIIVTQGDSNDRIEEGSEDFWKLFAIAESFTAGAINGDYGEPCTVVWCARLVAGADIFDWEFLPIGVGHKDAWKFRDAAYRQQDAYYANAFVNVDRTVDGNSPVSVLRPNEKPPLSGAYIYANSKAYKTGVVINDETYVDPNLIPRYQIPSNLVLKDLQEFLFLIQNRQDANGTDIGGKRTPDEWKSKNPRSFEQLVIYYAMIGNFSSARTLISGDYVRKFEQLVLSLSNQDPVAFVKAYLGETEYQNVRIRPDNSGDNSFISLSTGLYTTPLLQMRSIQPEGSGNTFGQEQVDFDSVEFGQYQDGVFIPEDSTDIIAITTDEPVISGYDIDDLGNITIEGGDAFILHSLVADQIAESFDVVKQNWLNIDFKLMHDKITESPNSRAIPVLENEFGTIMSQDLLSFTQLRDMYQRMAINSQKRYVDSGVLGVGVDLENQGDRNEDQSVFEKLVSNAQLSGIKKVNISNETLVEEEPLRQIDVEKVVEEVNRRNVPNVRDIL
jgi:hypothetical protein